jgi:peptidoglycan hydrolase CwlO-like protein
MKIFVLSIALLALAGGSVAGAEPSQRIQNLEDEIKVLQQNTSRQGEQIQSLESRVGSPEVRSIKDRLNESDADGNSGDKKTSGNANRSRNGFSDRYTD